MNDKIVQIIPAPANLFIERDNPNGPGSFSERVVCLALSDNGDVLVVGCESLLCDGGAQRVYFK